MRNHPNPARLKAFMDHRKAVLMAIPLVAAVFWGSSYVHEYAHAAVCLAAGYQPIVHTDPAFYQATTTTCVGFQGNALLLWSSGGLAGVAACLAPAIVFRKYKFVVIGFLPNAVPHGINAIAETFAHAWYITTPNLPKDIATYPMLIVLVILICKPIVSMLMDARKENKAKA